MCTPISCRHPPGKGRSLSELTGDTARGRDGKAENTVTDGLREEGLLIIGAKCCPWAEVSSMYFG